MMKALSWQLVAVAIALGPSVSLQAQSAAKQPATVRAVVDDVSDYRTTAEFNSRCSIGLKFIGDGTAEATEVIRVQITKAIDDLNRDLTLSKHTENPHAFSDSSHKKDSGPLKANAYLRNPSRNAASIKLLEGEVELFCPTPANGGTVVIKDFSKFPLAPIQNPMLRKHGLDVIYLTKEAFRSKKLEVARYESIVGKQWPDVKGVARVFVNHSNRFIVRVEGQYADGTSLATQTSSYLGSVRIIDFSALPPAGSQLMITVMSPETKRTFPFKLENIPLP